MSCLINGGFQNWHWQSAEIRIQFVHFVEDNFPDAKSAKQVITDKQKQPDNQKSNHYVVYEQHNEHPHCYPE